MPDTPSVSIQGKVVMPDGSPLPKDAPPFYIGVHSYQLTFLQSVSSDGTKRIDKNRTASTGRGGGGSTKKDGTFQIDDIAPFGANVVLNVYSNHPSDNTVRQLLSEPAVFVAHPGMQPLEIPLKKGIPVRGKVTYANGSPAADSVLFIEQQIEPALGADIPEMQTSFRTYRGSRTDAEGNYEVFLLPGEYTVRSKEEERMLMIAESDTEKKLDWTLPTPVFVEIKKQDDSLADEIRYIVIDDENISIFSSSARKGAFVIQPAVNNRRLYVVDDKLEQGTLETITPEMIGKTVQFALKPTSKVVIKLVDMSGKPLVKQRVVLCVYTEKERARSSTLIDDVETDSAGKAVLRVAPGKLTVYIELPGSFEKTTSEGGKLITNEIEKELDLAPGETFDVGTVQLSVP